MVIRVESLISSIHDYREESKKKLDMIKDDFKQLIFIIESNLVSRKIVLNANISKCVIQENE